MPARDGALRVLGAARDYVSHNTKARDLPGWRPRPVEIALIDRVSRLKDIRLLTE